MNTTIETTRTPTFAAGRPQAAAARPPVDEDKIEVGGALNPPVNEGRLLQNFLRLVQIPGNTRNERRIADTLKQDCTALGYEVFEDDAGQRIGGNAGNLIVNIPGNVPGAMPILFAAHMDTVRLAVGVRPQIRDGIISSDGTTALGGDDRAGCAEIMEAVREVTESNLPHGPIQLLFTVGEEGGLLGSEVLDPRHVKAEMSFVMDVLKPNQFYTQGEHLLIGPRGVTESDVEHAHTEEPRVVPPDRLRLTPKENVIMQFAGLAMHRAGLEPEFVRLEWAGTDAISLRDKGFSAISLGAGENNPHTRQETVAIKDLNDATKVVRNLIDLAARTPAGYLARAAAAAAVGGPIGAALQV